MPGIMPETIRLIGKLNTIMLFAAVVTASLFYSMQLMVMSDDVIPERGTTFQFQDITIPEWEPEVLRATPKPEEIVEPPVIPEVPVFDLVADPTDTWRQPDLGDGQPVDVNDPGLLAPADGNAMPIVQTQPVYPGTAAARGLEGFVIVEFDVSETGLVINPRILGSEPPRVFDRAALQAIERWKYNPRIVNGQPVKMNSLRTRFSFTLRE